MLMIKGILGVLFQTGLFAVLLLVLAGTWDWPRAIQFLIIYGLLSLISTIVLARYAPASLEARLQAPINFAGHPTLQDTHPKNSL